MAITIHVTNDAGLRAARALVAALDERRWQPVVERAAANTVKAHLANLEQTRPNKQGWPRVHYWSQAARSVSSGRQPGMVTVVIGQVGFRLRLEGGTIRPGRNTSSHSGNPTKWLTIPARAEAYGKKASVFGNLKFTILADGGPALVAGVGGATRDRKIKGQLRTAKLRGAEEGLVIFWLRKQVTQRPDPSVLPTEAALGAAVSAGLHDYFQAAVDRAGRGTS